VIMATKKDNEVFDLMVSDNTSVNLNGPLIDPPKLGENEVGNIRADRRTKGQTAVDEFYYDNQDKGATGFLRFAHETAVGLLGLPDMLVPGQPIKDQLVKPPNLGGDTQQERVTKVLDTAALVGSVYAPKAGMKISDFISGDKAIIGLTEDAMRWQRTWMAHPKAMERAIADVPTDIQKAMKSNIPLTAAQKESFEFWAKAENKYDLVAARQAVNKHNYEFDMKVIAEKGIINQPESGTLARAWTLGDNNQGAMRDNLKASLTQKIEINKPKFPHPSTKAGKEKIMSSAVHEADHISRGAMRHKSVDIDLIESVYRPRTKDYIKKHKQYTPGKYMRYRKNIQYLARPHEVKARIQSLRYKMGWKSFDDIPEGFTINEIPPEIRKTHSYRQLKGVIEEEKIADLMTKLSGALPLVGADLIAEKEDK